MLKFGRKRLAVKTADQGREQLGDNEKNFSLAEIAEQTAQLRARATELDCGFLAYLLAVAEDEARDQARRKS